MVDKLLLLLLFISSCGNPSHQQKLEVLDQCLESNQTPGKDISSDVEQTTAAEKAIKRSKNGQVDIQLCQIP